MEYSWRVKKSERGMSLENFIYGKLGNWSHKQVKDAIDRKRAFVNGKNVFISKWNLKPNAVVRFVPVTSDQPKEVQSRYRFVDVLFEDKYIIVANKPPFVDHESFADTIAQYLKRQTQGQGFPYVGQMHRLDRETSGIMIFTKKKVANDLADQFREHSIKKYYYALVDGLIDPHQGTINVDLEKGEFAEGRKVRVVAKGEGMRAVTEYRCLERYEATSLLQVQILTGRTHQIRAHMAHIGFPLVGDKLYGKTGGVQFRRQVLHAARLDFKHPVSNKKMSLRAPLPKDMQTLIDRLRGLEE